MIFICLCIPSTPSNSVLNVNFDSKWTSLRYIMVFSNIIYIPIMSEPNQLLLSSVSQTSSPICSKDWWNKIESQSKTASRLFENKFKTMSRPWLTSHGKTMFDKTMLSRPNFSRLCQDLFCQDHAWQDHVCRDHFCQDLVFRYHVMTNLIHSEPI